MDARVDNDFPPFLNEMVGKTFTFQLRLGAFNFTSKHQGFTVSRIIAEHERAPLPVFDNDVSILVQPVFYNSAALYFGDYHSHDCRGMIMDLMTMMMTIMVLKLQTSRRLLMLKTLRRRGQTRRKLLMLKT